MNYKVGGNEFYSFDEVVSFAEKHDIELFEVLATEEEKQQACRELTTMIAELENQYPCWNCKVSNCDGGHCSRSNPTKEVKHEEHLLPVQEDPRV